MSKSSETVFQILRALEAQRDRKPVTQDYANTKILDLGFDSVELLELVMLLEDHFNLTLDEQQVMACNYVSDLVALVESKVSQ